MKAPNGYGPQLDSLRAIAVLGVLYAHLWDDSSGLAHLGVRLFFVISGYLITGILLNAKSSAGASQGMFPTLKAFYARRALRIFPAYYLALGAALVFGLDGIRETAHWHIPYLSNFLFAIQNSWEPWPTAHLWSLSVEEQFYLVWPFLILWAPKRALIPLLCITIASAVFFRFYLQATAPEGPRLYVLTPAALDALGAGALLAALEFTGRMTPRSNVILAGLAAIGLLAYLLNFSGKIPNSFIYTIGEALYVFPMMWLVACARRGFSGPIGSVLGNRSLRYVGRISYGIYLYHFFALAFIFIIWEKLGWSTLEIGPRRFVVAGVITVLVAMISWHLIEEPLNRKKKHFPYPSGKPDRNSHFIPHVDQEARSQI